MPLSLTVSDDEGLLLPIEGGRLLFGQRDGVDHACARGGGDSVAVTLGVRSRDLAR